MSTTGIPVAAFELRANNASALASTMQVDSALRGLSTINLGKLDAGFASLGASIGRFVPIFTAAGVATFALSAVRAADALGDAAEVAGLSVESFSRLQHVAQQSDIEFGQLTASIRTYQNGLGEAIAGTGSMRAALGRLNLDARELGKLPLEEQLAKISDRFRDTIPQVEKTRIATDLFGKSGQALIPLLNRGSIGIRELNAEADRLGITLDTRAVQAIDRGTKALDKWTTAAKNAVASGVGNFLADIFGTGDELTDLEEKYARLEARLKFFQSGSPNASGAQRIRDIQAALAELEPRLQVLRDLERLQSGERISGGPISRRIDPVQEFRVTLKKINEDQQDFDNIMADIARKRAEEAQKLQDMIADGQQDVRDDAISAEEEAQKQITAIVKEQLAERSEAARNERNYERSQEEELQAQLLSIRQQGALAAQSLLTAYGGKFAGIARGILIIEKTMAIKSIVMDTHAAMMKVIKQWGAPWGYAAAAGVAVYGAARAAAVASTVAGGDSAPSIGAPHNPVYMQPGSTDEPTSGGNATDQGGQRIVQLVVEGNVFTGRDSVDYFIEQLQDRINEYDAVIINPSSRQARELIPEPSS
jgi:hypothetical protein